MRGLARAEYAALDQFANRRGAYIKDLRSFTASDYSITVAFRIEKALVTSLTMTNR
jgi:hypothetical protein